MTKRDHPRPIDSGNVPRFAQPATFMRLPVFENPEDVDIALVGVPWDGGTTNRAGTRHGPRQVRDASSMIRLVNGSTGVSPYDLCRVGDLGDAPTNPIDLQVSMDRITGFFRDITKTGARTLAVGGDHLMSLPILRGIVPNLTPEGVPLAMVHFDAHSDTIDSYFDGLKYTHGTPFKRAVEEGLLDPNKIVQIGLRGSIYDPDEKDWPLEQGIRMMSMDEVDTLGLDAVIKETHDIIGLTPCYVTFDIDVLDPAFAPGTGTPEVGGFNPREALKLIRGLRGLNIVSADVPEVSPPFDPGGNTALLGANIMFELLCLMAESRSVVS